MSANNRQVSWAMAAGRRRFLGSIAASLGGWGASPWLARLARAAPSAHQGKERRCVLLWMGGGPSQTDTFDMKPGHANGGPIREVPTAAAGLRFSEHLPRLGRLANDLVVLRGLSTREGDHGRGTYLMRTGHSPDGLIRYPTLGAVLSKQLEQDASAALPAFVAIAPNVDAEPSALEAGFLGPRHAPLVVAADPDDDRLGVAHLRPPAWLSSVEARERRQLLEALQADGPLDAGRGPASAHRTSLERALRLIDGEAGRVFDLDEEPANVRERYGVGVFGQGCLLARRLLERGVSFVEVSLGDGGAWDTHSDNFASVARLSAELDAGWSTLMEELRERGLLESTTIVWMGEFGRTPQINGAAGRDHFPDAWTAVLAGGGLAGGQAHGRTSADGMSVEEGKIGVGDLWATLCAALGLDPRVQNISEVGRPFRIAEGRPIEPLLKSSPK